MLNITKLADNDYYVELLEIHHNVTLPPPVAAKAVNRVGYKCDKGHLETLAHNILSALHPSLSFAQVGLLVNEIPEILQCESK